MLVLFSFLFFFTLHATFSLFYFIFFTLNLYCTSVPETLLFFVFDVGSDGTRVSRYNFFLAPPPFFFPFLLITCRVLCMHVWYCHIMRMRWLLFILYTLFIFCNYFSFSWFSCILNTDYVCIVNIGYWWPNKLLLLYYYLYPL